MHKLRTNKQTNRQTDRQTNLQRRANLYIERLDKKLQLLVLIYACKYNALFAFECSDIALNFFYPEKFLSSAG